MNTQVEKQSYAFTSIIHGLLHAQKKPNPFHHHYYSFILLINNIFTIIIVLYVLHLTTNAKR